MARAEVMVARQEEAMKATPEPITHSRGGQDHSGVRSGGRFSFSGGS